MATTILLLKLVNTWIALHLNPTIGVLLNIDSDHLDYFRIWTILLNRLRNSFLIFLREALLLHLGESFCKRSTKRIYECNNVWIHRQQHFYAENISFDDRGFPEYDICHEARLSAIYI